MQRDNGENLQVHETRTQSVTVTSGTTTSGTMPPPPIDPIRGPSSASTEIKDVIVHIPPEITASSGSTTSTTGTALESKPLHPPRPEKEESFEDLLRAGKIPDVIRERLLDPNQSYGYFAQLHNNTEPLDSSSKYEGIVCSRKFEATTEKEAEIKHSSEYKKIIVREGTVGKYWNKSKPVFLPPGEHIIEADPKCYDGDVDINSGYIKHGTLHAVNVKDNEFYYAEDRNDPKNFKVLGPGFHFIKSPTLVIKKIEIVGLVMRIKLGNETAGEEKKPSPADPRLREGQDKAAGDLNKGYRVLFLITPEGKESILMQHGQMITRKPGVSYVEPHQEYFDRVTTKLQTVTIEIKEAHTADNIRVNARTVGVCFQVTDVLKAAKKFGVRNLDNAIKTYIEAAVIRKIKEVNYRNQLLATDSNELKADAEESDTPIPPSGFAAIMKDLKRELTHELKEHGIAVGEIPCPLLTVLDEPVRKVFAELSAKSARIQGELLLLKQMDSLLSNMAEHAKTLARKVGSSNPLGALKTILDHFLGKPTLPPPIVQQPSSSFAVPGLTQFSSSTTTTSQTLSSPPANLQSAATMTSQGGRG